MPRTESATKQTVHDAITERMMAALENGTVPWQKPWGDGLGWPRSMSTSERYKGINVFLLGMTALERGYESPWWGTFKQIQKLGGQVMRGQNRAAGTGSTTILFYDKRTKEEAHPETGEPQVVSFGIAKAFHVFNAAQCEDLPAKFFPQPGTSEVLAEPQAVLDGYLANGGPTLRHVPGDLAYYSTDGNDVITLPLREQFKTPAHYYSTAFHEGVHSTGAPQRLNRPGIAAFDHFGSGQYAKEELVAQMGSAMLLADTGLDSDDLFDNSAAYVANWLGALGNDHRLVSSAASLAQRAVEHIVAPVVPA